jgi:hypothetical protein
LLSPTTKAEDLGPKKDLYEQVFKTAEYFCVDPEEQSLQGWQLEKPGYVRLAPDARGWLWSDTLQLWLGLQEGSFQGTPGLWLRFFASAGGLIPTAEEVAEAERARAEAEHTRAEAERTRAEAAEAENARLRAELERLKGTG